MSQRIGIRLRGKLFIQFYNLNSKKKLCSYDIVISYFVLRQRNSTVSLILQRQIKWHSIGVHYFYVHVFLWNVCKAAKNIEVDLR